MSRYDPNGKAHRILARAVDGPVSRADLRDAADTLATGKRRTRLNLVIKALIEDSLLVAEPTWGVSLTADGARALDRLRAGEVLTFADRPPSFRQAA